MRVAVYARFSSDLQDARSIGDQIAVCRDRAARESWQIVELYSDAAISGATIVNRPGLQDLLHAARARAFDLILTESLDRISRDLADISAIWRELSFIGVRVHTLSEGEIGFMHVGLKGIVGQMFLADLAAKTRRGHVGRLRQGRIPGGKLYGYDVVPGEEKGLRQINETEAAVVRSIFKSYDLGRSARDIAVELNRKNVPAPFGGQWNASTINGSAKRESGILQNRLYIGQIVYGRQKFEKNPATGKRIAKVLPRSEWMIEPAPHLAIVDRELFERVTARRASRPAGNSANSRRPKHLFSGLVKCGCCDGPMIMVKAGRFGCSYYRNRGTCDNNLTIEGGELVNRVLRAVKAELLAPDVVATAIEAYRLERKRLASERARSARDHKTTIAALDQKIKRLLTAIEDGASATLTKRLRELENERARLEAESPPVMSDDVLAIHPAAAKAYRKKIEYLSEALALGDDHAAEAKQSIRALVRQITVTPGTTGQQRLTVAGDLGGVLSVITDKSPSRYHLIKCTFRA